MSEERPLKPADVADLFSQSLSWVSKHYRELGGAKIGGRVFFPPREVIYERLFCREEGLAVRFHSERSEIHKGMVSNQERGQASRRGAAQALDGADPNRHALFGSGQQAP